ncbi:TonB-dependent receptor [Salegentibacter mishustinae]|uniref:TonB-dependent receptor n=1 Tax=Salegentibacter mishustinae TaxID=270918 RepID=A0A0Q9Z308_9FLAO|nr:carboxypeptidase-like regulatory domain-containing protein [Salegentibacter mishustinae]KRG27206.1 TonB-dependent receptor [Salegentibacter mishustinae]PNW21440.1 TonB-dependent receptor [Salegentibacter mishustinae]PZX62611.1 outer membrane receptor protein involved in Fe transport [Salegentibacter mishustinae]GGW97057.1 TonB-dependent receptor [Salegentibacter mishustinae]
MRKYLLLFLLIYFPFTYAQTADPEISISFQNKELPDILVEIEAKTDYQFFFDEDWFGLTKFSGEYSQTKVTEVLEDLLEETNINYFVKGQRIILTSGSIIYDRLPEGFLKTQEETAVAEEENQSTDPVFYNDNEEQAEVVETVLIGKENRQSNRSTYKLSGRVVSEKGEPISGLNILIPNQDKGTVTDINGNYEIRLPKGINIFETQALGVDKVKKRLVVYNDGVLNLQLKESFEELGEVLVEANARDNVRTALTGVERIDVAEIKNIPLVLGERDILKVATTLPGISTAGEGASGYNVRGGKTDQNLILLDEGVIYNPAHFFGIFSGLNPFTTGDVSIYKGSIPAEYGGRLSSVFDLNTKTGNKEEFTGEVSIGPVTGNLSLEIPIVEDKSSLIVGGRGTYSDWILNLLEDESLEGSQASFYDVVAKYNHKFDISDELNVSGYYSSDVFSITSDSLFSYTNRMFSLSYNKYFNEKHQGELVLTNSNYDFNLDYASDFDNDFESGYTINESEVKLKMKYFHSKAHTFNYGISGKYYMVSPGEINPGSPESLIEQVSIPEERALETAVYIEDSFEVTEKLLINAGLRYSFYTAFGPAQLNTYEEGLPRNDNTATGVENYDSGEVIETYGGPEVRVSGRYFITPTFSTKVSYNNTYQYIHTLSNNTTAAPTDTYKLSDSYIKPQRANQFGLGFFKNFDENIYELSLEGYYKTSDNLLDYKIGADLFLNENIETEVLQGEGEAYGVEFLVRKNKGRLNGYLGYTYSRSFIKLAGDFQEETVNNGEFFPTNFDKPHDFSSVLNYKLTQRFSFSANFVYQTGRPVTYPIGKYNFNNSEYVLYSDRNQFRIPDYYRLDLSFNVEGNHKIEKFAHSFWNISVYNVLGRNNPYSVFFVTDSGEVKAYQSSIFSIPIPTITYNFRF